ncbi:hypothetical protein DFJ74DRAFT_737329 [Hyaloraphidium curvatum]|nr:hypothetical protein DFJ74DRAFT_714732 [Hyaloraphidium curvatum]KAI9010048.1 hypothetical protein DFJ74DRAFT_737329 [Hyaloraphidium curvatum]
MKFTTAVKIVALLIVALLIVASVASAAAAPPSTTAAVFRRSCADCAAHQFCEYAHPGAPAGMVACVAPARDRRALYKRYAPACADTGEGCSRDGDCCGSDVCVSGLCAEDS